MVENFEECIFHRCFFTSYFKILERFEGYKLVGYENAASSPEKLTGLIIYEENRRKIILKKYTIAIDWTF